MKNVYDMYSIGLFGKPIRFVSVHEIEYVRDSGRVEPSYKYGRICATYFYPLMFRDYAFMFREERWIDIVYIDLVNGILYTFPYYDATVVHTEAETVSYRPIPATDIEKILIFGEAREKSPEELDIVRSFSEMYGVPIEEVVWFEEDIVKTWIAQLSLNYMFTSFETTCTLSIHYRDTRGVTHVIGNADVGLLLQVMFDILYCREWLELDVDSIVRVGVEETCTVDLNDYREDICDIVSNVGELVRKYTGLEISEEEIFSRVYSVFRSVVYALERYGVLRST